jgi:hypothetical protein
MKPRVLIAGVGVAGLETLLAQSAAQHPSITWNAWATVAA